MRKWLHDPTRLMMMAVVSALLAVLIIACVTGFPGASVSSAPL